MDDTFVYCVPLPSGVDEMVMPCLDGYTVYINENLSKEKQIEAYNHALSHIRNGDFDYDNYENVHTVETRAHGIEPVPVEPKPEPIMTETEIQERLDNLRKRHKKRKRQYAKWLKFKKLAELFNL